LDHSPLFELSHLAKTYGDKRAVADLSLSVGRGEFFGFLGPNGAGKTTTIRMLAGLLRPTAGSVRVMGEDPFAPGNSVKSRIGLVLDDIGLYERLTAREHIGLAAALHGLGRAEGAKRTEELLEFFSLTADADKIILDYSLGMRKKTAIACALIHNPALLVMDEPFTGIDPVAVHAVKELLARLVGRGLTVFFSSHAMEQVEKLASRIAVLVAGELKATGTAAEIKQAARVSETASLEEAFIALAGGGGHGDLNWLGSSSS
jgi:ABC-2 type transport system ATP-binding protein